MLKPEERLDLIQKQGYGIIQNKKWFSYGIDAVLVSHFAEIESKDVVVDLGTGTGIIPLLLSLNYDTTKIYGVEKQHEVAEMASRSIQYNQKHDAIEIIESDILNLHNFIKKSSVDVVVSNPPYFKKGGAIISGGNVKAASRHETSALMEDFIRVASSLLKPKGRFYMVHRPSRLVDIMYYCRKYKIEPKSIQFIYPSKGKSPNILLIKCVKNGSDELKYLDDLYVYDEERNFTSSIFEIYRALNIDVFEEN